MKELATRVSGGIDILLGSPEINSLFDIFKTNEEKFYHCTPSEEAYNSIKNGTIRLTRADSFEDKKELFYGFEIFEKVLSESFSNNPDIISIIEQAKDKLLTSTFIFSTSKQEPAPNHLQQYGNYVFTFKHNFMFQLLHGQFREIVSTGRYSPFISSLNSRYVGLEGKVIYDEIVQEEIVNRILRQITSNISNDTMKREYRKYKLVMMIIHSVCFFKDKSFGPENEYRFVLISKHDDFFLHFNNKYYIEMHSLKAFI